MIKFCDMILEKRMINFLFAAKKADSSTDTTEWEKQIDQKVYELYGLADDDIKIVEGR